MLARAVANLFMATFTPSHAHARTLYVISNLTKQKLSRLIGNLLSSLRQQVRVDRNRLFSQRACQYLHTDTIPPVSQYAALGNVRYFGPGSGSGLGLCHTSMSYTRDPKVQPGGWLSKFSLLRCLGVSKCWAGLKQKGQLFPPSDFLKQTALLPVKTKRYPVWLFSE